MPESDRRELPPGLDLLWGRRAGGSRGPRPGLSPQAIVAAAVTIADAEGLEAVSMARVATQLGFTTMSLYRHVTSKDELLALMWNASAEGVEHLELHGDGWRARLRDWAAVQRRMIDRHPWITQMPMVAPPVAPNSLAFVEKGLATLHDTPLRDADKLRVIGLLSSYTLSEARMAHDAARAQAAGDSPWAFDELLRELVDPVRYPRLHALATSAAAIDAAPGEREEFDWGIERILDGVEALIARSDTTGA